MHSLNTYGKRQRNTKPSNRVDFASQEPAAILIEGDRISNVATGFSQGIGLIILWAKYSPAR
jgi:hypothetical protein